MPSKLPRLNVVMDHTLRDWIEKSRRPTESAAAFIRRVLHERLEQDRS